MKRVLLTLLISAPSSADTDATPRYINALAAYFEEKLIGDAELVRVIDACESGAIANPFLEQEAKLTIETLHAHAVLQDYVDDGGLDATVVCAWAKHLSLTRRRLPCGDQS